jgi:hypothetical protein
MNNPKRMQKEVIVANLKYYHGIFLEGLRKITNNLSQDGLSQAEI